MSQIKLTSPLTSKIAFKSIFTNRRKPSIEKKDTNNTEKVDRLETFINENKINCYAYSDFKSVQQINRETSFIKRAILNDEFFVLKSFNNDDETIRQIVCELESLRTIIHENILKFHGIIRIEDGLPNMYKHILVLEYANNGSLSAYLREQINKLDWKNKLSLALQLAKAVSYLHDNDIIHRDLQANEILIHQKSIKLAAFGLPSVVTKDTLSLFDTIPYMDPINFDCIENCELDKRSNVYSIGVLLWQITSGRKPFYTERPDVELAKAIFRGRREETVMGTPMEYSRLYKECWNHEPNKRPDMKRIVSNLNQLLLAENSSPTNSQKEKKDDATKWVENVLKNKKVDFIPLNDLKDPEPLGKGGFGYIKKAIWTRTGKYVVYKRLINTDAVKYNTLDAFIHELKIHLHLSIYSDRIVRCLGISQDDITQEYLLVTQFADGGDLRNYLKKNSKNLTWEDKKRLAYQIADGLNYLHNEQVLHKDLHSKNIVIHENNAKIIDFGISKIQDRTSASYTRGRGIIAYVDPKRLLDPNSSYTTASDIYSLGVLMWEISSGYPPFKNSSFSEGDQAALSASICNGNREKTIPGTPEKYGELYRSCWNHEPNERPTMNKILDEFVKWGFGVNSGKKNKFIQESTDDDDDDDDNDLVVKT